MISGQNGVVRAEGFGPVIDEIANEMSSDLKVGKMNVDECPEVPTQYGIKGIPALILFQDGKQIAMRVGDAPKATIVEWIQS